MISPPRSSDEPPPPPPSEQHRHQHQHHHHPLPNSNARPSSYIPPPSAPSPRASNWSAWSRPPAHNHLPPIRSMRQGEGSSSWAAVSPSAASATSSRGEERYHADGGGRNSNSNHANDDDDDDQQPSGSSKHSPSKAGGSSKRSRVHFSCTECHRRKQKCNRQTPCQHCIARKVPDRCKTFQPGQDEALDLTGRVGKLERTVEEGFDRIMELLSRQQTAPAATTSTSAPAAVANHHHPYRHSLASISAPTHRSHHHHAHPLASISGNETGDEDEAGEGGGLNAAGTFHASGASVVMKLDTILADVGKMGGAATVTLPLRRVEPGCLNTKMREYGAVDSVSSPLLSILPPPDICRLLLKHFWNDINWIRHPIPETFVRPKIEDFLASKGSNGEFPPSLTTSNVNVFACLALILAVASLSIESARFPRDAAARRLAGRRLQWAGQQALVISNVLGKDDVMQILAFGVSWRFLMVDRRINEAWRCSASAVQSAYSIGLHRDGSKLGLSQLETDLRRGVWQSLRFGDLVLAMNLGRPCISDLDNAFADVLSPTPEGLDHWWKYNRPTSHPDAKPGIPLPDVHQHATLRNDLARICSRVLEIYQKIEPHHYSDVLDVDAEILQIQNELPHYYRIEVSPCGKVSFDSSLDAAFDFLANHRFMMHMEINYARINLHRSYLLRSAAKSHRGQRYAPSRRACVESAMQFLAMRTEFVTGIRNKYGTETVPLFYYVQIGSYSWFNSLTIASIAALADPTDMPELPALREQIATFLSANELRKTNARAPEMQDEMRDKEAVILKMFSEAIDRLDQVKSNGKGQVGKKRRGGTVESMKGSRRRLTETHEEEEKDDANGQTSESTSREEATADVLLDLGKSSSTTSKTQLRSSPLHLSIPSAVNEEPSSTSHSAVVQHRASYPNSSNISSDSPSSKVVDDAQADLNAWFTKEFAGGPLVDHSLTDLGVSRGVPPRPQNSAGTSGASIGRSDQAGGNNAAVPAAPDLIPHYAAYNGVSAQQGLTSNQGQGSVQWATLPQPAWGDGIVNNDSTNGWASANRMPASMIGSQPGGTATDASYLTGPGPGPTSASGPYPGSADFFPSSSLPNGTGVGDGAASNASLMPASLSIPGAGTDEGTWASAGGGYSFDPGFWAEFISKIST